MHPTADEPHPMNGWPSSSKLLDTFRSIDRQLGGLQAAQAMIHDGQKTMRIEMLTAVNRVHERIDDIHRDGQSQFSELQNRVTTLEAIGQARPPKPPSAAARLRDWLELIAPLKELMAIVAVILASLATLSQAPAVKAALLAVAGVIAPG